MNVIIDLILIQIICVNIVDISGVVSHIENAIARALSLKYYAIVLVLCFLTSVTKEVLWTVRDFFIYIIRLVNRLF